MKLTNRDLAITVGLASQRDCSDAIDLSQSHSSPFRFNRSLHITMRTSRVSRDTSRILAASRTQRTLRQTRSVANITAQANGANLKKEASSDSELSSIPADSGSDGDARPAKKRRTAQDAPMTVKHESKEISIAAIASPKKESKPKKARRASAKKITGNDLCLDKRDAQREPRTGRHNGMRESGRSRTLAARPKIPDVNSAHAEQPDERHSHICRNARHAGEHAWRTSNPTSLYDSY
jgi:hypothetical protein